MRVVIIVLKDERLYAFPIRLGIMQGCPFSQLLFNIILKVLDRGIRHGKNKRHTDWKERKKYACIHKQHVYVENPKASLKSF